MKTLHSFGAWLAASILLPALAAHTARAQDAFPSRPIRLVVPFAAGGPTDVHGRYFAAELSRELGQQVIVENKTGAGGAVGATDVTRSEPNGYTMLFSTASSFALYNLVTKNPTYDVLKDLTTIAIAGGSPASIVAAPQVKGTLKDVVAFARANPGKLDYGSPGTGTLLQLTVERMKVAAGGIDIVHVPYRGSGPAMNDVVAGQISLVVDTLGTSLPQHRAASARILGIAANTRSPLAPDIPTIAEELGLPDFEAELWNAVAVRAGTPQAIVDRLQAASEHVIKDPAVQAKLVEIGITASPYTTPETARAFVIREQANLKPAVEATGLGQN